MNKFILAAIDKSMAPAEVVKATTVVADYFQVNKNGDVVFYEESTHPYDNPPKAVVAFASGSWLAVDGQTLNYPKEKPL